MAEMTQMLALPGGATGLGGGGGGGRGEGCGGGGAGGVGSAGAAQTLFKGAPADVPGHAVTVTGALLRTCRRAREGSKCGLREQKRQDEGGVLVHAAESYGSRSACPQSVGDGPRLAGPRRGAARRGRAEAEAAERVHEQRAAGDEHPRLTAPPVAVPDLHARADSVLFA